MNRHYYQPYEWYNITETKYVSREEMNEILDTLGQDRRWTWAYEENGTQKDVHLLYNYGRRSTEYKEK